MEEWKEYKIEEIISEISMGPFGSDVKKDVYTSFGVPILNGSNLQGFKLKEDSFGYVSEEKANSLKKCNAHRGDIIVTHRGTLGQIVYIPDDSKYDRYVISQSQFRLSCKSDIVRPDFLVYLFHTKEGQYKILSNASQVGVPALARATTTFRQIKVNIPSLCVQTKIMNILSSLDDKIEVNRRINDNLEQQAQALYKQWFVDNRDEDWEEYELNDVATITAGGDKPQLCTNKKTSECCIPIYSNGIEKEGLYGYTNVARIFENAITISARGTIGFVCLRTEPYVPIVRLISVVPMYENLSVYFLYLWAVNQNISGTGTTQQQLTVPDFRKTKIIIPHQDLLMKFNSVITPIFNCIKQNKEENDKLVSLRDTLLPKLMSGELSVDDVLTDLVC